MTTLSTPASPEAIAVAPRWAAGVLNVVAMRDPLKCEPEYMREVEGRYPYPELEEDDPFRWAS